MKTILVLFLALAGFVTFQGAQAWNSDRISSEAPQEAPRDPRWPTATRKALPPPGPVLGSLRPEDMRTFTDPAPVDDFTRFANWATRVLSERFEVRPPKWELYPQATTLDCTEARIYTPETETIRVYENGPNGAAFTPDQRRYVFLHGFLHHLHKVRGQVHQVGHVKEFDRWMRVLGLWSGQ